MNESRTESTRTNQDKSFREPLEMCICQAWSAQRAGEAQPSNGTEDFSENTHVHEFRMDHCNFNRL